MGHTSFYKKCFHSIFVGLGLSLAQLSSAQIVLKDSPVVFQGKLGVCASASLAVILENETKVPVSFVDIAISSSFAKGLLFDLQGSTPLQLLHYTKITGACPRSESFYENQGNQDNILGTLHEKILNFLASFSRFGPQEKILLMSHKESIASQIKAYRNVDLARNKLISGKFLNYLYRFAREQGSDIQSEGLEWIDGYAEYSYYSVLEDRLAPGLILKQLIQALTYAESPWEIMLKKKLTGNSGAIALITEDLKPLNRKKILTEIEDFSEEYEARKSGFPTHFTSDLAGIRRDVLVAIAQVDEFEKEVDLTEDQIMAMEEILTTTVPAHGTQEYVIFMEDVLENLRTYFRVACTRDSSKRIPIFTDFSDLVRMEELKIKHQYSWVEVFREITQKIQDSLLGGLPVAIGYDVDNSLMNSKLPPLTKDTRPSGPGHASVITGMRKIGTENEFLVHNSYGEDCSKYYDAKKCENGKIWVSERRLIPYLDDITFFNFQ